MATMVTPDFYKYIPVGSLLLRHDDSNVPSGLWSLSDLKQWRHFDFSNGTKDKPILVDDHVTPVPQRIAHLPADLQQLLIFSRPLSPYKDLLLRRWIHCAFCVSLDDEKLGIVRVYLLPDDVDRRLVDRSDTALQKARTHLLAKLDFSRSTWNGEAGTSYPSSPVDAPATAGATPTGSESDGETPSLLQMFNRMPAPNPQPSILQDDYSRDAMVNLMESKVPGLKTELYTYQRRSAALMLQREEEPQQFLDPRLVKTTDQIGNPWYYDAVTGVGLREPRMYDGPRGGILAEQMGSGKTVICLALILASRDMPARTPEIYFDADRAANCRPRVGSLADMAAAAVTKHGIPWNTYFGNGTDMEYTGCLEAIQRNPGWYNLPTPRRSRSTRRPQPDLPPRKVYNTNATLVIVPPNLAAQWRAEIAKHTEGLKVCIVARKDPVPPLDMLKKCDIVLFSYTRFQRLKETCMDANGLLNSPIAHMQFKRCIIDEGHRLGNATGSARSDIQLIIDSLQVSARWIVTGTPSKGLYGVDESASSTPVSDMASPSPKKRAAPSIEMEKDDLKRIGSIAAYYLKVRPWANAISEPGDTPADWQVYMMQPRHSNRSFGRQDCLQAALESLIIRHPLSEIGKLLPDVRERIVYLEGSYQDKLALNVFAMMIIANAVQSQRTDADYFFHNRQRKSLKLLVHNLRQASFFGGSFLRQDEIHAVVDTAEKFLEDKTRVPISADDEALLREAVAFGKLAEKNEIKTVASMFHEVPIYVEHFPGGLGQAWSLDRRHGDPTCTDPRLMHALQKFLAPSVDAPHSLQMLFDSGRFVARGRAERMKALNPDGQGLGPLLGFEPPSSQDSGRRRLAGNTSLGEDRHDLRTAAALDETSAAEMAAAAGGVVADALARTRIVSTASAKLSYLVDQIARWQGEEQIIVFYENENVAWYLAGMLDILQIQYLIYARDLTPERRSQYVVTFNKNPKFRVMIMDIHQAAFGLDMRSVSRIYFINPVFNPQVEAQAIGRARRISQRKPVTVETLVLRDGLEEVLVRRRAEMTPDQQRRCKDILDDGEVYAWIRNVRIVPMPALEGEGEGEEEGENGNGNGPAQMAWLERPQRLFGRGFGREVSDPDEGLVKMPGAARHGARPDASADSEELRALKRQAVGFAGVEGAVGESSGSVATMEDGEEGQAEGDSKRQADQAEEGEERPTKRAKVVVFAEVEGVVRESSASGALASSLASAEGDSKRQADQRSGDGEERATKRERVVGFAALEGAVGEGSASGSGASASTAAATGDEGQADQAQEGEEMPTSRARVVGFALPEGVVGESSASALGVSASTLTEGKGRAKAEDEDEDEVEDEGEGGFSLDDLRAPCGQPAVA